MLNRRALEGARAATPGSGHCAPRPGTVIGDGNQKPTKWDLPWERPRRSRDSPTRAWAGAAAHVGKVERERGAAHGILREQMFKSQRFQITCRGL